MSKNRLGPEQRRFREIECSLKVRVLTTLHKRYEKEIDIILW